MHMIDTRRRHPKTRSASGAASSGTFRRALGAAVVVLALSGPSWAEEHALTDAERAAGWQLLFDGRSLEHFRGFKLDQVPAGWSVSDGKIHFAPPSEGPRADLLTREQYGSFDLIFEWAVSPAGNSGVMFHVSEDQPAAYSTGPEYQILDNAGHRDGQRPITSAASNYALDPPSEDTTRPLGEFNEGRLRVEGDVVTHWLNGVQVVQYRLWTDEWKEKVAASKFASMPRYGLNRSGHIAFQDHGDEIWLRRVRILPLD